MTVWIVNHYAISLKQAGGTRHFAFAKELTKRGHEVTLFVSQHDHHGSRQPWSIEYIDGIRFVWIRTPSYVGNSWGRIKNMLVFAYRMWRGHCLHGLRRPDVVVGSSPHPFAALAAERIAVRFRVPFVLEVRDLWPLSLVEVAKVSAIHPFVILLRLLEMYLYERAVRIITLPSNAAAHMVRRGAQPSKIVWISNGVDLTLAGEPQPPRPNGLFTIMYAGAHGIANNLDSILDAAALLQKRGEHDLLFRFIGEGTERERLIRRAERENIHNVRFEPAVSKSDIYMKLQEADMFVAPAQNTPLYDFGISFNKLFDYMAVARPIVFGARFTNAAVEAGAAISIDGQDREQLANAILTIRQMPPSERWKMGQRGRTNVETSYNLSVLSSKLENVLMATVDEFQSRNLCPNLDERLKRYIDIVFSALILIIAFPLIALIALIVRLTMGSPVLFRQVRPGYKGACFTLLKFRTMAEVYDAHGRPLPDRQRLTTIGRLIRHVSLDELPQFWNVLCGDMSIVGPRPLRVEYLERYTDYQARRHEAKPGITGWSQINGRNRLTWEQKFDYDVWYVDHRSIFLDLRIMLRTIGLVLTGRGVSQEKHETMPEFMGTSACRSVPQVNGDISNGIRE